MPEWRQRLSCFFFFFLFLYYSRRSTSGHDNTRILVVDPFSFSIFGFRFPGRTRCAVTRDPCTAPEFRYVRDVPLLAYGAERPRSGPITAPYKKNIEIHSARRHRLTVEKIRRLRNVRFVRQLHGRLSTKTECRHGCHRLFFLSGTLALSPPCNTTHAQQVCFVTRVQ